MTADQVVTCGDCHQPYRRDVNLLTGKEVLLRPHGCTHPFESVLIDGRPPASIKHPQPAERDAGLLGGSP